MSDDIGKVLAAKHGMAARLLRAECADQSAYWIKDEAAHDIERAIKRRLSELLASAVVDRKDVRRLVFRNDPTLINGGVYTIESIAMPPEELYRFAKACFEEGRASASMP